MFLSDWLEIIDKRPKNKFIWQDLIQHVSARLIQKTWYEHGWKMIVRRKHIKASRFRNMKLIKWTPYHIQIMADILDRKTGHIRLEEISYYRNDQKNEFRHITVVHQRRF